MELVLFATLTELFQFQPFLDPTLVFRRPVIQFTALGTLHFNQVVLRHIIFCFKYGRTVAVSPRFVNM